MLSQTEKQWEFNHEAIVLRLAGFALFFAATGQARSDAIYWTDLLGDRTPHAVAVGDFNRGGIPHLAVANDSSRNVSLLRGGV